MSKTDGTESAPVGDDDPGGMRKDMRDFHRNYMLTIWLIVGIGGTISVIIWAALYFSGR